MTGPKFGTMFLTAIARLKLKFQKEAHSFLVMGEGGSLTINIIYNYRLVILKFGTMLKLRFQIGAHSFLVLGQGVE